MGLDVFEAETLKPYVVRCRPGNLDASQTKGLQLRYGTHEEGILNHIRLSNCCVLMCQWSRGMTVLRWLDSGQPAHVRHRISLLCLYCCLFSCLVDT